MSFAVFLKSRGEFRFVSLGGVVASGSSREALQRVDGGREVLAHSRIHDIPVRLLLNGHASPEWSHADLKAKVIISLCTSITFVYFNTPPPTLSDFKNILSDLEFLESEKNALFGGGGGRG